MEAPLLGGDYCFKFGFIEQIQRYEIQDTRYRTRFAVRVFAYLVSLYLVTCISPLNCNLSYNKIQINPPLPSLMILSRVSDSFIRDASGICSSLVWMLSPTSS